MNEERTGKCLQMEHIRDHLWHRYFITVNQGMAPSVILSKWWLQFIQEETLDSVAPLLAATLYQGHHDIRFNFSYIELCAINYSAALTLIVFCVGFFILSVFVLCLVWSFACVLGLTILDFPFGFLSRIFNLSSLNMSQYYALRLYFPYLSVNEPVHITVYKPGPFHIMLSSEFCPK